MLTYPIMTLQDNLLCLVPVTIFHRALQVCAMMPIQILKYPILILQSSKLGPFRWLGRAILHRCQTPVLLS